MEALPTLVQQLHHLVSADDQLRPLCLRQVQPLGQLVGKGDIKDAVIQNLFRFVVVHHPHRTEKGRGVEEVGKLLRLLHKQSHLEQLPGSPVLLGAEIGNIEIVLLNQLQHSGYAARGIPQAEFHQQHGAPIHVALETAQFPQTLCGLLQPGVRALRLDKQRVGVDGLVVADPRDVQTQLCDDPAGPQKCTRPVRHGGDKRSLHGLPSLVRGFYHNFPPGTRDFLPAPFLYSFKKPPSRLESLSFV